MCELLLNDLKKEIKNVLVYPKEKVSTREDASRLLQMPIADFDRLRREGLFDETEILGVKFFENKELFDWAFKNRPEVTDLLLQFE
jgi:hypothetical protein